jgi:hypothetical protein
MSRMTAPTTNHHAPDKSGAFHFKGRAMSELDQAQREALLASAAKHEDATKDVRAAISRLNEAGYMIYADKLRDVVIQMISHVDTARELARKK